MEIHRQTCQKCGSREMRNLLARAVGESDKVFVQCVKCGELVARYTIGQGGYYHHGKGYESYLRSLNRGGDYESTRDMNNAFNTIVESCEKEFAEILKHLEEKERKGG
ncbi:MAG: hypothetical protein OEY64_01175 [Nitrospinota bacterium]|nr:hypothetical protein [Nitrospinota bacterium]